MKNHTIENPALNNQGGSEPVVPGPDIKPPVGFWEHTSTKITPAPAHPTAQFHFADWIKAVVAGTELLTPEEREEFSRVYASISKSQFILQQIGTREDNELRIDAALKAGEPMPNLTVDYAELERIRAPFVSRLAADHQSTLPKLHEIWDRVRPLAKAWLARALEAEKKLYEKYGVRGAESQIKVAYAHLIKELDAKPLRGGAVAHPSVNLDLLGIEIPFTPYAPAPVSRQAEQPQSIKKPGKPAREQTQPATEQEPEPVWETDEPCPK